MFDLPTDTPGRRIDHAKIDRLDFFCFRALGTGAGEREAAAAAAAGGERNRTGSKRMQEEAAAAGRAAANNAS